MIIWANKNIDSVRHANVLMFWRRLMRPLGILHSIGTFNPIRMHACVGVSTYTGPGQFLGGSILPPLVTNSNTSWLLRLGYGMYPREKISHSKTPKDLQEADCRIRRGQNKKGRVWERVPEGFLPRICFWCKDSLHEGLRRHPLHRQHGSASLPVIARPAHT